MIRPADDSDGALLFLSFPLLALCWTVLFGRVRMRQVGRMPVFAALTLTGSIAVALILKQFVSFSGNPVSLAFGEMTTLQFAGRKIPAPLDPKSQRHVTVWQSPPIGSRTG